MNLTFTCKIYFNACYNFDLPLLKHELYCVSELIFAYLFPYLLVAFFPTTDVFPRISFFLCFPGFAHLYLFPFEYGLPRTVSFC